ncbi:amidohydrolase family protein [Chloroflexota bacterium]
MVAKHEEWLMLAKEDPIDPDLPICDTHHHFVDHPDDTYLVEDLLQDIEGGHNIVQTVYVQGVAGYRQNDTREMRPVGETEFVIAQSERGRLSKTSVASGIVGFADLLLGSAVEPVLEAHIAVGEGRFRGIRYLTNWDASTEVMPNRKRPKGVLLDPKFREGFECLHKHGLSFDAWVFHTQLMELLDLARAFQNTPIILNHIGGPIGIGPYAVRREEVFQEWKRGIAALAKYSNIFIKLGGLAMPLFGFGWNERAEPPGSVELAEVMAPYYCWCIEQFGVDRCMFESNFPVDKMSYSYTVLWNAFKRSVGDFSPKERAALFHDTAVKVYRLTINIEG